MGRAHSPAPFIKEGIMPHMTYHRANAIVHDYERWAGGLGMTIDGPDDFAEFLDDTGYTRADVRRAEGIIYRDEPYDNGFYDPDPDGNPDEIAW